MMKTTIMAQLDWADTEPTVRYRIRWYGGERYAEIIIGIGDTEYRVDMTAIQAGQVLHRLSQPPDKVDSGGRRVS